MKKSLFFLFASVAMLASCTDKDDNLGSSEEVVIEEATYVNSFVETGYPNDKALAVGDITPDGKGMVFWVDPTDNTKGKAISLAIGEGLAFDNTADIPSYDIYSPINGPLNCRLITEAVTESGDMTTMEALNFCTDLGDHWYLPASEELVDLFEVYNGTTVENATVLNPAFITAEETAARAAFDELCVAAGARILNTQGDYVGGDLYWASNERDNDRTKARNVRYGAYLNNAYYKTDTTPLVRGMQILGSYEFFVEEMFTLDEEVGDFYLDQEVGDGDTVTYFTSVDLSKMSYTCDADWLDVELTTSQVIFKTNSSNEARGEALTRIGNLTVWTGELSHSFVIYQNPLELIYEGVPNTTPLAVGDLTPDKKGMVFWVDSTDNTNGKAVSLVRASRMLDSDNQDNSFYWTSCGIENVELFKAKAPNPLTLDAINFCDSIGENWYMPALDEMMELFEVYNGTIIDSATVAVPSSITEAEQISRAAFDTMLMQAIRAAGITDTVADYGLINQLDSTNSGDRYWAATEDPDPSYTVGRGETIRFGSYAQSGSNKAVNYYVRAMQVLGTYTFKMD